MNYFKKQNTSIVTLLIPAFILCGGLALMPFNAVHAKSPPAQKQLVKENFAKGILGKKKKKKKNKKDPYACAANKKGPNIYSANPPKFKTRGQRYSHLMGRKQTKTKSQKVFSYTEPRYNLFPNEKKSKKQGKGEDRARQVAK